MESFLLFAAVGFAAQLVDGALGMAFGVVSTTVLLSFGVPPATASASVHAAELATTAASGASHIIARNVNWKLLGLLVPAGAVGGALGAYVLTSFPGEAIKPFVVAYLGAMGIAILWRGLRNRPNRAPNLKLIPPLGAIAGFTDAAGGGGWGPLVTSTLMASGGEPRKVIGTVNTSEFLVAAAISAAFLVALFSGHWYDGIGLTDYAMQIGGLIFGGLLAAPMAAWAVTRIKARPLCITVGLLVVLLSGYQAVRLMQLL
ncbi:MAG: sulfite exporter TauE/SafE family protein [Alphaproteobacteria bacterium]